MKRYAITPSDLLFFRDGRPMETGEGSGGHGARWPFPTIFFDAIHAALHRAFPESAGLQPWEHSHKARGSNGRVGALRFGSLRTVGPFPRTADGNWLFPAPLDAKPGANGCVHALRLKTLPASASNLPSPLTAIAVSDQAATKDAPPPWWTAREISTFLETGRLPVAHRPALWDTEWTTGIGTDSSRDTQDGSRIFSAAYLRLKPGVSLGCASVLPISGAGDGLHELFPDTGHIICGGQQRICSVKQEHTRLAETLPHSAFKEGTRVKWTLLSPAIFPKSPDHPGGWLPSWVDPVSGQVLLPREKPPRRGGESRAKWRRSWCDNAPLDVKLVAACIGKPEVVTGWSDFLRGSDAKAGAGKTTRLAVPAGSSYYFEGPDAPLLSRLLSWDGAGTELPQTRSGALGEKGLGLGVTGHWLPL
jgi:hypothetical protein